MKRSIKCNVKAPINKPITATNGPPNSIAGTKRLKDVAASITPAAKPSKISNASSEKFFLRNIEIAPTPVAKPANKLAMKPI